uniref:TonB-dependent receptor n=1 Tax=Methyloterricola oryzae TaxID=1495050 RepID=UPI0005EAE5CD
AQGQYDLAKQYDPKDPTPWFYDAIKKQAENRPVEALRNLDQSIRLNDNRIVYRSKQRLDDDLAARSASLARIYATLGFDQRALFEGWRSSIDSPTTFSAHRLLSDAYRALSRHELAQSSELFQSQLLQPASMTPIQPRLAETTLLIPDNTGPALPGFNEFNPLFVRDRLGLQVSGLAGGFDTYSDEVVQSGVKGRASYSLGQFHYETNGFRANNDLRHDIYSAFAQYRLTPDIDVQAEYRHRESEVGDLRLRFDNAFSPFQRTHIRQDNARIGGSWNIAPQHRVLASYSYQDRNYLRTDLIDIPQSGVRPGKQTNTRVNMPTTSHVGELEYLFTSERVNSILGAGYSEQDSQQINDSVITTYGGTLPAPITLAPTNARLDLDARHGNVFLYNHVRILDSLKWTVGVSYDAFRRADLDLDTVNPKLGLIWNVTPDTALRAAWFQYQKRLFSTQQTLEPTHVAGFNQMFDDIDATRSTRYGVGVDQRFGENWKAGAELSWRDLKVPNINAEFGTVMHEQSEQAHRAYVYWTPSEQLAIGASYFYEATHNPLQDAKQDDAKSLIRTHRAPITLSYFHPTGFFATAAPSFVYQKVNYRVDDRSASDTFWVLDVSLGYRLPKRYGIVTLGAKNLTDEHFHFEDTNLQTSEPVNPLFQPRRYFYAQFTLSF